MSASKRKQDEKHTKMLRELGAQPFNKQCFDCHQRGPTYVNMTIGSFVCTGCSGILRGLNPPHRVKSISMAAFTPDEIDFVKNRGNDYCKKVWLGLYDGDSRTFDGYRDEQQMKDFLILKYERKRWYVNPAEIARQQSLLSASQQRQQQPQSVSSSNGTNGQTSPKSQQRNASLFGTGSPNTTLPQSPVSQPSRPPVSTWSSGAKSLEFLDSDPFSSPVIPNKTQSVPPPKAISQPGSGGNFANFANFDAFAPSAQPAHTVSLSSGGLLPPPPGHDSGMIMPKSATVPASLTTGTAGRGGSLGSVSAGTTGSDKYSALAELDGLFNTGPSVAPGTNELNSSWTTGTSVASGSVFGESSDNFNSFGGTSNIPKSGSAFVSSSASVFGANSNPFFSGVQPPGQAQTYLANQHPSFGGMGQVGGGWSQQPHSMPTSTMPAVSNPFFGGGLMAQPSGMGFQQGSSNPFGGLTPTPVSQHQQQIPPHVSGAFAMQSQQAPGAMWGHQQQMFPPQSQAGSWQQNPFMGGQQMGIAAQQQQAANWNPFL